MILRTIMILLLAGGLMAADLDSTRQARVSVYRLLGMDTTGTDNLGTGEVDFYVNQGIKRVNEDLRVYRKHENITLADGTYYYVLDSVVFLVAAWAMNSDSVYGLRAVNMDTFNGRWEFDEDGIGYPEYYFLWGDSVGFVPSPRASGNVVDVLYAHLIPTDSIRFLPSSYRFGAVLYAAFLAANDVGVDGQVFINSYAEFINSKRGIEPSKK